MRSVARAFTALALAGLTACGSTVQQQTLQTAGAPAGPAGPGTGLEVPGDELGSDAGTAAGPGSAPADGTAVPGQGTAGDQAPGAPSNVTGRPAAPDAPDAQPAPPTGGTADRSALKLGLLYVNNDAAAGAGVDNGNTFGPRRVLEALVRARNATGGLGGRRIVPTWFEIKSSSSSYAADLQAACSSFAEDAEVSVVMSFLGLAEEQLSACLAKAGIVHLNGSYGLGDTTTVSTQPTTASPNALGADRRLRALLEQMKAVGHLTASSRIGVLVEGCPYNQRAAERTLLPTAEKLGLNVVRTRSTRCFGGINDLSGLASDAQNAVLDFNTQRIDRVLFVSAVEGNILLVFATAAESQGYRPGYALSSLAIPNVIKDNVPQSQMAGAKGMGWLPSLDDDGSLTPTTPAKDCVATLRSQGLSPASRADHWLAFAPCDTFALADAVLKRTSGDAAPGRFFAALSALGTGWSGAGMVEGRTDFRDGRREGPARARTFAWSGDCSCFRYVGSSYPV